MGNCMVFVDPLFGQICIQYMGQKIPGRVHLHLHAVESKGSSKDRFSVFLILIGFRGF